LCGRHRQASFTEEKNWWRTSRRSRTRVAKAKPAGAKGTYIQRVAVSSTMGPGVKVEPGTLLASSHWHIQRTDGETAKAVSRFRFGPRRHNQPFFCLAGATPGTIARGWTGGVGVSSSAVALCGLRQRISVAR